MKRKDELATGEMYHIFNKSIAEYRIFNYKEDFIRIKQALLYYRLSRTCIQLSNYLESNAVKMEGFTKSVKKLSHENPPLVQLIAYCVMPTHLHLILKQLQDKGIAKFMSNVSNSYSRYFNEKMKRRGPLWTSRFQNVRVKTNEQLLHLTRYVHLNPVTASLVSDPGEWEFSSFQEYLSKVNDDEKLCDFSGLLEMNESEYQAFVNEGIDYQKQLAKIKNLLLN